MPQLQCASCQSKSLFSFLEREGMKAAEGGRGFTTSGVILLSKPVKNCVNKQGVEETVWFWAVLNVRSVYC